MPSTTVTPDQDTIVSEIDIAAPPERVFKAISDAEETRRRSPELDVFEMDPRVGGRWRLEMKLKKPYRGFDVIRHEGEIVEIDPPRLLAYTWLANFHTDPKMQTLVRLELTATDTGTHLRVRHSGLAQDAAAAKDYAGGWPGVLDKLKTFIEHDE